MVRVKWKYILETAECCGHIRWSHCEGAGVRQQVAFITEWNWAYPSRSHFQGSPPPSTASPLPPHFGPRQIWKYHMEMIICASITWYFTWKYQSQHALHPEVCLTSEKLPESKSSQRESASARGVGWTEQWAMMGLGPRSGRQRSP